MTATTFRGFHPGMAMQLALAASASLLEIGPTLWILERGGSLQAVLLVALAYQCGNVLARFIPDGRWPRAVLVVAGLVAGVMESSLGMVVGTLLLSSALQLRRRQSLNVPSVPVATKRSARVIGFLAAPFLPVAAVLGVPALLILTNAGDGNAKRHDERPPGRPAYALLALMVVHQVHYFLYAYAVISLVHSGFRSSISTAVIFALGWVTYLSAERLWGRLPSVGVFIVGHLTVATCLLSMSATNDPLVLSCLWILTGFGGGSVYCLTRLLRAAATSESLVAAAEDTGHVAGVLVAIGLVVFVGFDEVLLCAAAGGTALATAAGMLLHAMKERRLPVAHGDS